MLIGIIPFIFLVYFTFEIYQGKTQKLELFENYKSYLAESANINRLIDALQQERKFSFDYAMTKSMWAELVLQRPRTDSLIQTLLKSEDPSLAGFMSYTKLENLAATRNKIDSFTTGPNDVMHFYSSAVFRLNTLNTLPPANTAYLQPVYNTLVAQKLLSEMITYLGIIQGNIYNVLYTRKYMIETLIGTMGAYDVYKSYEKELQVKAASGVLGEYNHIKKNTAFAPTITYIDTLFKRFTFDSSYTAATWSKVSDEGMNTLRNLQAGLWQNLDEGVNKLYQQEKKERSRTLVFLLVALVIVMAAVTYIVLIISSSLKRIRLAAEKIANGQTGIPIQIESKDAIGSLAMSISIIDERNQVLAEAADAIGRGDFSMELHPRSEEDNLGIAIIQMKTALQQYKEKMEQLVAERTSELARSNYDLQQFAHVASHDLKEPLRKISIFSNILLETEAKNVSENGKMYLSKLSGASGRMSAMIEGILAYSTIESDKYPTRLVDLNKVVEGVLSDLELLAIQKEASITYSKLPHVTGIAILLQQLFYNLINNGLKFSKEGVPPVISISANTFRQHEQSKGGLKPGNYVHLTFKDNGIGFNPEYNEQMFGIFFRLNSKDLYEGTGLGLALCRKIVMRHKGQINAESKEGQGATFHVLLPASI